MMMVSYDAFYKFTFVGIGGVGSQHDSTTFQKSLFGKEI